MRLDKFGNELDLLLLLTDNNNYTAQQLADQLHVSRRNLYYYLEYFRRSGFQVVKTGAYYRIDPSSRFFKRLHSNIALTVDEARYLRRLLENSHQKDMMTTLLKTKLDRYYGLEGSFSPTALKRIHQHIRALKEAIASKNVVVLKGYSSPHSRTVSDRMVEPFLLMNDDMDVRCYEIQSGVCKTFKLSRIQRIDTMDVFWMNEDKHREVFTDIFMFSGDQKLPIKLRLGQLAYNILIEEYPMAQSHVAPDKDGKHWIFKADMVSYLGIGRFVLGLFHDIEILHDAKFKQYIAQCIEQMQEKMKS